MCRPKPVGNVDLTDLVHVFDDQMLSGTATTYQITITPYNAVGANAHLLSCLRL